MMEYHVRPAEATDERGAQIAHDAAADMRRSYAYAKEHERIHLTPAQQQRIDQAVAAVTPERTLGRIIRHPNNYFIAERTDTGEIAASARFNYWGLADQAPYEREPHAWIMRQASRVAILNTYRAPFGIHTLIGHDGNDADRQNGFDALTKHAVELSNGREIRIGVPAGDPQLEDVLDDNDFRPINRYAQDVTNVPALAQRLWIHHSQK
jgi:hypothetical protein